MLQDSFLFAMYVNLLKPATDTDGHNWPAGTIIWKLLHERTDCDTNICRFCGNVEGGNGVWNEVFFDIPKDEVNYYFADCAPLHALVEKRADIQENFEKRSCKTEYLYHTALMAFLGLALLFVLCVIIKPLRGAAVVMGILAAAALLFFGTMLFIRVSDSVKFNESLGEVNFMIKQYIDEHRVI
ncbi:MAG: hypothetical protein II399_02560 [Lachnospiraceae bacterium]|nr:hypothetical protein [Lachnospiraceae bacterium]